ncbi:MAG: hypothetical protein R3D68_14840 [Hyphomicrobiaceae bacterium]
MTRTTVAALAVAAALGTGMAGAKAADLDYGYIPHDRYASAYEDPRYRDLYGHDAAPPREHYRRPFYAERVQPPIPRVDVYPPDRFYREGPPRHRHRADACVPHEVIRDRLESEGWRAFRDVGLKNGLARVHARRRNGDLYALKIDRCSGEIVASRLLRRDDHVPYAWDSRRDPPQRPYY